MMGWLIETMIAASLLMLAVLILRGPVLRHFGPRAAYLLWLAPALRMVLPPLPESWASPALSGVQNVVVVLTGTSSLPLQSPIATGGGTVWLMVLSGLWLGGASLFFLQHLISYWVFTRDIRTDAEPLFAHGRINVARSNAVISPVAFGIFGKTIIVPSDFIHRFDETEQRLALSHETFHHRRGDMLVNVAALAILSFHWFNPLAHFAHRVFRLDQEAACDDLVLAGTTPAERQAYGSALYKSATGGVPLVACAMGTASQLKARLQCIVAGSERPTSLSGMGLMVALVVAGLASTASGMVVPVARDEAVIRIIAENRATSAAIQITVAEPVTAQPAARPAALALAKAPAQPVAPVAAPQFQAPPTAPFAPVAPEQRDPRLTTVNCAEGPSRSVFIHRERTSFGFQQGVAIIVCESRSDQPGPVTPASMMSALEAARADLIAETQLTDAQRAQLVGALEFQIVQMKSQLDASADPIPTS